MARIEEIVGSIDRRLAELDREIGALTDARAVLNGKAPAALASPTPVRRSRARRAEAKRRPARRPAAGSGLEQQLAQDGPSSAAALAKRSGDKREHVVAELEQLERDGRVRRAGRQGRVRWRLVSDEERIAARTAELAKQSRKQS